MLLTITTTCQPATDLGYLLHKNPARLQTVEVAGGVAHVFYPEARAARCTAALLLDLDPVGLVRGRGGPGGEGFALEQYINDRPYVASSFLSVALSKAFGTAMNGSCKDRPHLPAQLLPLTATVAVVSAPGPDWPRRLFEPLGYAVETEAYPLDPTVPAWGASSYYTLTLRHEALRLPDLLAHLYVLLPVLDNDKHYIYGPAGSRQAAAPRRRLAAAAPGARLHHPALFALSGRHRQPHAGPALGGRRRGIGRTRHSLPPRWRRSRGRRVKG